MGPVPYTGMGSGTGPYKERDIWGQAVHRKGSGPGPYTGMGIWGQQYTGRVIWGMALDRE